MKPLSEKKKLLVVQPNQAFAKSHFSFTINFVQLLVEAGHEVHLLVPLISESEKLGKALEEKYTVIYFMASEELRKAEEEHKKHGAPIGMWHMGQANEKPEQNGTVPTNGMAHGTGGGPVPRQRTRRPTPIFAKLYLEIASDLKLMDRLRAQHYDIGIAEAFMTNEWSLALFRLLGLPRTVVTTAMAPSPEYFYYLGMLARIKRANVPSLRGTKIGDHLEEKREGRRAEMWQNFLEPVQKHLSESVDINVSFQDLAERLYGLRQFPVLSELFSQVDVYLSNSQPEIDWPASAEAILTMPNNKIRYIGGMNALRGREEQNGTSRVDPDILARANDKRGMVLFSLGTVLDTNNRLSREQFEAVKGAMGRWPELLFIWRLTEGDERIGQLNGEMGNVYASEWVDQPAILAHPKTVAFISHCGMNSALEAAWNGVPLVCLPCMGDQYYNSEALASRGLAIVLDFFSDSFTEETLATALGQILGKEGEDRILGMKKLGEVLRRKDVPTDILEAILGTGTGEE